LVIYVTGSNGALKLDDIAFEAVFPDGLLRPRIALAVPGLDGASAIALYSAHLTGATLDPDESAALERIATAASVAFERSRVRSAERRLDDALAALSRLQERFAVASNGFGGIADRLAARLTPAGLPGQFVVGLLLGAVWSPCVGPTLGAAATLAAQREALGEVALVMLLFGLGAALPLLVIGTLSRAALLRWRGRMSIVGHAGKTGLGVFITAIGLFVLSGADRYLETVLVEISPDWLTDITTRF